DNDPMLIRRINDFVNAKMVTCLNLQSGFLRKLPACRFRNALERVNLPTRNHPTAAQRVFVPSSEENLVGLIANQQCRTDSWKIFGHNRRRLLSVVFLPEGTPLPSTQSGQRGEDFTHVPITPSEICVDFSHCNSII